MLIWQRGEYSRDGTLPDRNMQAARSCFIGRTPVRRAVGVVDSSFESLQIDQPFCAWEPSLEPLAPSPVLWRFAQSQSIERRFDRDNPEGKGLLLWLSCVHFENT